MKKREGVRAGRRPQDPAESWELEYTEREGGFYFRGIYAGHPFAPSGPEDVPAGAWESLRETCGLESMKQLLIIPSSVRAVGRRNRKVITPMEVLAVGTRAVGLWAEKPAPAVRVAIGLDELAALEDVHILLYGRLSFLSRDNRLTIRYNTVCRRILEPVLQRLREKLAGPGCPGAIVGKPDGTASLQVELPPPVPVYHAGSGGSAGVRISGCAARQGSLGSTGSPSHPHTVRACLPPRSGANRFTPMEWTAFSSRDRGCRLSRFSLMVSR